MPPGKFPAELAEILTPKGLELLEGRGAWAGVLSRQPFFSSVELIDAAFARTAPAMLEHAFGDLLVELTRPLPSPNSATSTGADLLPKVARSLSTKTTEDGGATWDRGMACGIIPMLQSESYRRFVTALVGRPVVGPAGMQALCLRPGDYAGPHADHIPENPAAIGGYTDVHFTFSTPGVKQQYLVYERNGHLSEMADISACGTLTAYRLPIWHYTTPMQGEPSARRWLVLNSFTDG